MSATAVNDAPTSAAPAAASTAEDAVLAFTGGNALSVGDVDGSTLEVTLSVGQGALSLGTTAGLSFTTGDGTSDGAMTFSGSQASLNAALATLSYTPTADYNGAASLVFGVSDGVAPVVTKTVNLSITAVADIAADSVSTAEDTPITFNAITGTNAATADSFEGAAVVTAVTQGAFGSVSFAANGQLTYTPNGNASGADSFTYTVTSGGVTETATVSVTVNAVNDAPTATNLNAGESYTEDTALNLVNIVVADVDNASVTVTLTLSDIAAGSLSTATSGAVTSTYNAGTGVWSATGAITSVNTLLAGVSFTPTANYNQNFTIATSVTDGTLAVAGSKAVTGIPGNSAPRLAFANPFASILEDSTENLGTLVTDLVAGQLSDPDGSVQAGIAVTSVDESAGRWEYSLDGGVQWTRLEGAGDSAATLLAADGQTRVRFIPDEDWNGAVSSGLTFRAWDLTQGTAGLTADVSVNGGSTAFSDTVASASIVVQPVNDAPVQVGDLVSELEIEIDAQPVSLGLETLAFVAGPLGAIDELSQVLSYTVSAIPPVELGIVVLGDGQTAVVPGVSYTLTQFQQLQFLAAVGTSGGTATFSFVVSDGGGGTVGTTVRDVTINVVPAVQAVENIVFPPTVQEAPAVPPPVAPAEQIAPVTGGQTTAAAPVDVIPRTGGDAATQGVQAALDPDRTALLLGSVPDVRIATDNGSLRARLASFIETLTPELLLSTVDSARPSVEGFEDLQRALRSTAFEEQIDRLREEVRREFDLDRSVAITAAGVSLGASVLYVLWLIRGGVLLSSYLSAMPAWRVLDPLPVLGRVDDEEDSEEDELEALAESEAEPASALRGF